MRSLSKFKGKFILIFVLSVVLGVISIFAPVLAQDTNNACALVVTNNGDDNPLTFNLTANGAAAQSATWDFGDGTTATGSNVVHAYANEGDYTVTLRCTTADNQVIEQTAYLAAFAPVQANTEESPPETSEQEAPPPAPEVQVEVTAEAEIAEELPVVETTPEVIEELPAVETTQEVSEPVQDTSQQPLPEATNEVIPTEQTEQTDPVDSQVTADPVDENPQSGEQFQTQSMEQAGFSQLSASCQMDIGDAGDDDPFTYVFTATGTGIANYAWNFGDTNTGTGASVAHAYTATGTFPITLTCTPSAGSDFVLSGSISVVSNPVAGFYITPGTTGYTPFDIFITNTSSGSGVTYEWVVTGPESHPVRTDANPSYTFTTPGSYTIELTVTDSIGTSSSFNANVEVLAEAPDANFVLSPTAGTIADTFTVTGVDEGGGPITSWTYTVTNEGGGFVESHTGQGPHTIDVSGAVVDADGTVYTITLDYSGPGGVGQVVKQIGLYPGGGPVDAIFSYTINDLQVCFNNESTGPWVNATWTLRDVSTNTVVTTINDNGSPVCYTFASGGNYSAELRVEASDASVFSTDLQTFALVGAPIAVIDTSAASPINVGTPISFSSGNSSGVITAWEWSYDPDGDGTFTTVNTENLNNVVFQRIGANTVTLTVTGPGGSSSAQAVIMVAQVDISCGITGDLTAILGDTDTYTANIGNANGRTINYSWSITGSGVNASGTNNSINQTWGNLGAYLVSLTASTADGSSSCTATETVQVTYENLGCSLTGDFGAFPPSTTNYAYNVAVSGLGGRTAEYQWYVDGAPVGTDSNSYIHPAFAEGSYNVSVAVTTADGSGECTPSPSGNVNVAWSTLTCNIGGNFALQPDGSNQTYTSTVGGDDGQALTYAWLVTFDDGSTATFATDDINITIPATNTIAPAQDVHSLNLTVTTLDGRTCGDTENIVANWDALTCNIGGPGNPAYSFTGYTAPTANYGANLSNTNGGTVTYEWLLDGNPVGSGASLPRDWTAADAGTRNLVLNVTTTGPDGGQSCSSSRNINVGLQGLSCSNLPQVAATFPATGFAYSYESSDVTITNDYGRPVTIDWAITGGNVTPTSGTGYPFTFTMNDDNTTYTVTYTASIAATGEYPATSCQGTRDLTTSGVGFTCQTWDNAPASLPSGSDNFSVVISNPSNSTLNATWTITRPDGSTNVVPATTTNDTGYGASFSLGDFGTVAGNYTYALSLTDGSYTCGFPVQTLGLGTLNVGFSDNVNNNAVSVSESVCLTNDTTVFPGAMSDIVFSWDFDGVQPVTSDETPACFEFGTPGTYTVTLNGDVNGMTDSASITYTVYAEQAISIDYIAGSSFAPSNVNFNAIGTNITGNYQWAFYDSGNNLLGNLSGQNVSFFFNNADTYRAVVTGDGPLGTTEASAEFTLLGVNDIRAAFTPSIYGAEAPVEICFTDRSMGSNIVSWQWNFGNGQTMSYTDTTIPAEICTTYTTPGQIYTVGLIIENSSGLTATASNVVRTYNLLESQSSFTIDPQGNGNYCFTPNLPSGATVTGWTFQPGGGNAETSFGSTGNGQVCNLFLISGTYLINMDVDGPGGPGRVTRPIEVNVTDPSSNPSVNASAVCVAGPQATFTVGNSGDSMTVPDQLTIRNATGQVIYSDAFFQLNSGQSVDIDITGHGGLLTLNTLDTSATTSTNCPEPPNVVMTPVCLTETTVAFTISNSGGDMSATDTYTLTDSASNVLATDTFLLLAGDPAINLSAGTGVFTLALDSGASTTFDTQSCLTPEPEVSQQSVPTVPQLSATGICEGDSATFTVTNAGATMNLPETLYVVNEFGEVVFSDETFQLEGGTTSTYTVAGQTGTLTLGSFTVNPLMTVECSTPVASSVVPSIFPGLSAELNGLPDWSTVETCGSVCVTFDIYHTNHTGDWEIFRLDGGDEVNRETMHQNLSYGEGDNITDLAPSRSPNGEWIIFTSNRDGNWELYVAPVNGDRDAVQRVTYNTVASDTDPVWGPHQYVVFETTRNGNWELYLLDMTTGQEIRMTDQEGDDINPSWSPDGSRVIFQSNRDGLWQIYEIDLLTLTMNRLSDGSGQDVDPSFNNNGDTIAFRSYRDGDNSVIYLMNEDGSNPRAITSVDEDATNHSWSPTDLHIGYQSNRDGDLDIYIYETFTGETRQLTNNEIDDYAPTWRCDGVEVVFTSDIEGNPNIFDAEAIPVSSPSILVEEDAQQLTFEPEDDIYPENSPGEENASREGQTRTGEFGEQTSFLNPPVSLTPIDLNVNIPRASWMTIDSCSVSSGG